jgi:hypothetical protein
VISSSAGLLAGKRVGLLSEPTASPESARSFLADLSVMTVSCSWARHPVPATNGSTL